MTKTYGGLFQLQPGDLILYRNIWMMDLKAGFFVVVQDRLWTETSPNPISEEQPFAKFYTNAGEAVVEADKNYDDSLKAGFRPIHESY
jgi:hypothetical protein